MHKDALAVQQVASAMVISVTLYQRVFRVAASNWVEPTRHCFLYTLVAKTSNHTLRTDLLRSTIRRSQRQIVTFN